MIMKDSTLMLLLVLIPVGIVFLLLLIFGALEGFSAA